MPRTAAPSRSLRSGSRTDSFEIISAPPRHPAVRVVAWLVRMRAELFVLAVGATVWFTLRDNTSLAATITVCVVLAVLLVGLPWTRRYLIRRGAAVITRHRLRQTLIECRALNYSRACPLMLWSHPTRVGESVWIFLRAGIAPEDIDGQCAWIAAGCFAREARVVPLVSMTALVRVEVIRRDPLAPESIDSDLGPWAVGWSDLVIPVGATPVPPHPPTDPTGQPGSPSPSGAGSPAPEPVPEPVPASRATTDNGHQNGHQNGQGDAPAPGRGGDWSDYV